MSATPVQHFVPKHPVPEIVHSKSTLKASIVSLRYVQGVRLFFFESPDIWGAERIELVSLFMALFFK